jgi:hypothetical protein
MKTFALLSLALLIAFPAKLAASGFDETLSDVARGRYETNLPYAEILKAGISDASANQKIRFEAEFSSLSDKPLEAPYSQLLNSPSNSSLLFKGLDAAKLPVFVNDGRLPALKRLAAMAPGSKIFVYATLRFANVQQPASKKGQKPSTRVAAYLLVDDILTPEEEDAMAEFRAKFSPKSKQPVAVKP